MVQPTLFTGKKQMQSSGNLKTEALSFASTLPPPLQENISALPPGVQLGQLFTPLSDIKGIPVMFKRESPSGSTGLLRWNPPGN